MTLTQKLIEPYLTHLQLKQLHSMKRNKNIFHWLLMAAVVCTLGGMTAACSDDDDDELSAEERAEQATVSTSHFWRVVGQLTDGSNFTEQWQDATFEPTIGEAENGIESVRVIATGDLATAAKRFADLVGVDGIAETTDTYTWSAPEVGTLTYKRTGGASLATVDVDIKQMPTLSRLVYKTPEQMGANGTFKGTAYYRFGDVVAKTQDGHTDYWVCVRPAFGPEGKEDSHWVTLSPIYGKYIKEVTIKSTGQKTYIPQGLNAPAEHLQNLAELLFAMEFPGQYSRNLSNNYKTLGYFHDFHYTKNYKLNCDGFFAEVGDYWRANNDEVGRKVLGRTLGYVLNQAKTHGLCLISDASMSKEKLVMTRYTYSGDNLKTEDNGSISFNCANAAFNVAEKFTENNGYAISAPSVISERPTANYFVRYATGKELCKGSAEKASYDKRKRLTNCTDVYVYNQKAGLDLNNLANIEPQKGTYVSNDPYYKQGDVYTDAEGSRWFCFWPAGIQRADRSEYAYFMTFDNIKTAQGGAVATNLPSRNLAIRAAYVLQQMDNQLYQKTTYTHQRQNILQHCDVEVWKNIPLLFTGDVRTQVMSLCIAYDDGGDAEFKGHYGQPLLRVILDQQWHAYNENTIDVWQRYPTNASYNYPQTDFGIDWPIMLQDVANQTLVNVKAPDKIATLPESKISGGDDATPRQIRTKADERAQLVTNYLYNRAQWQAGENPTSMWNEPVYVLRVAKVYDRGKADYSTKTTDGRQLTPKSIVNWWDEENEEDDWLDKVIGTLNAYGELLKPEYFYLNGVPTQFSATGEEW